MPPSGSSESDKKALLERHEFFRDLPAATLVRLATHARVIDISKGRRIFSRGEKGHGLLAVISGMVRISVPSTGETELVLALIGPEEIFGEIALLDGQARTADATAMTACRLLLLERRDFLGALMDEPVVAIRLLEILSRRLRRTSRQLEEASFGDVSARLAKALLSMADASGSGDESPCMVKATQRQLGNMIGLSRESTNKHLRAWQQIGVVDLTPGGFIVRDKSALIRIVADLPGADPG